MRRSLSAIASLAILIGACAAPATAPTAASPAPQATAQPKRGGTLVVAASNDPGHFNTAITTAGGTQFIGANLYNGLVFLDEKLEPKPDLAESWVIGDGGRTYTFKLRQGVKWHDGKDFSSADVKFSFEQVLLKYHARTKAGLENVLAGIDAPDPSTVVFRFKQPYGPLLQRLDVVEAPIVAKHVYEGTDPTNAAANLKPVGTGPFKLAEYVKNDRVRFVRNETYFKKGLPYLDELVFRIIPQASTQVLALERGEIDYLASVPGPELAKLRQNQDLAFAKGIGLGGSFSFCLATLIFNLSRPPLDRVEVRQAIVQAIDGEQILERVYFGQGRVGTSPIGSALSWAYNPNLPRYRLDLPRATSLLDAAGLARKPDGTRTKLTFVHASTSGKLGEVLKQQLSGVGIDLDLQALEFNAATDRIFVKKDFDLAFSSYCSGPDPELGATRVYVSSNIGPVPFSNGAGYRNPRVDELFQSAAASTDRQQRARAYFEIQDILVREVPYWWLVETEGDRAYSKKVRGLQHWSGTLAEAAWRE